MSVSGLIVIVVVVSLSVLYCAIKTKRRSAVCNSCKRNLNPVEELYEITHNNAYGQVKESPLAQDDSVVYEAIKDNCLYEMQANMTYGPRQFNTPCYVNLDEVIKRNSTAAAMKEV